MDSILTLNAGSSSLKFGLYRAAVEPDLLIHGHVDGIGNVARLIVHEGKQRTQAEISAETQAEALAAVLRAIGMHKGEASIKGVGHRIVHGGPDFAAPVELTREVQASLAALSHLAPLHQPHNLAGVEVAERAFPEAVQVACFDTAFHNGHPWVNDVFAIPRAFHGEGVRRYGFHGLSYDYVTGLIAKEYPELHKGRIIIAHLGNGASMCAVRSGKSVGSTMGFTALDGLPMGTRCGQIDPGVVLHLIEQKGMTPKEVTQMLYKESGLLGLSGESRDMRALLTSKRPEAAQAIDYYVFRARREIGALSAVLCGLDALVFCGGIGENADSIRHRIVDGLGFLGLGIRNANSSDHGPHDIGSGPTRVLVIPTDEERVIARAVQMALNGILN